MLKTLKIVLLLLLTMLLIGCGKTTQVVTQTQVITNKIPNSLLELEPLQKPNITNELDIIKAYATLFYSYQECKIKIEKIKELNNE